MIYTVDNPPIPWVIDSSFTLPWEKEEFDESLYPKGGFIEDAILYSKGYETTNAFAFWSAVHEISSVIMRSAHLRWAHGGLYPNFYLILVAPPGVVKKSTTMSLLDKVEFGMRKKLEEKNKLIAFQKSACIIRGKATQESIFENMRSDERRFSIPTGEVDEDGEMLVAKQTAKKDANLIMRISELSTFLSPSKYNANLIDKITDFYDCKDRDSDTTIGRGNVELENVFATLCGATTPDTFKTTIPKEAFGGGFMSRCIVIRENTTPRIYPQPVSFPICPSFNEMTERLAWIALYKKGQFTLSAEAYRAYASWYREFKLSLIEDIKSGIYRHTENRKDIHVLKLALVFALQKYDLTENVITEADINMAINVLDFTLSRSAHEVEEAGMNNEQLRWTKLEEFIRSKGEEGVTREKILKSLGRYGINAKTLTDALENFIQSGMLEVRSANGVKRASISKNSKEIYTIHGNY